MVPEARLTKQRGERRGEFSHGAESQSRALICSTPSALEAHYTVFWATSQSPAYKQSVSWEIIDS
jgi:hypothetical protein